MDLYWPASYLVGQLLPDWSGSSLRAVELRGGDGVPLEVQPPIEAAPDDRRGRVRQSVS